MGTLGSYVIDGRGMRNANNIDVNISVDCCLQPERLLKGFLWSLMKFQWIWVVAFYYLWPLSNVWEPFSKLLPKIIINKLQYLSTHAFVNPCFYSVFFSGIRIYVLFLGPPQRNYAVFKKSSPRLFDCVVEGKKITWNCIQHLNICWPLGLLFIWFLTHCSLTSCSKL